MPSPETARIIISGGGTGGHIFPAIAIANALREMNPACSILFVGALGKMEMEKVPAAGYTIKGLPISGIKREWSADNLRFPFKLIGSLARAISIVSEFKPGIAIGVGGYASGPLLFAASMMGIPTLIQEQNSYPGITNRILAARSRKICVAYPGMEKYFPKSKLVLTGNPVRKDLLSVEDKKEEARKFFSIPSGKPVVLVVGGSQGARSINRAIAASLSSLEAKGISLIWQTGSGFAAEAKASVAEYSESSGLRTYDFISRMDLAYALADVVVARAGASTVSELCIVGRPAILVPLPTAAEDHQTRNCEAMVNQNAAILVRDGEASERLLDELIGLVNDQQRRLTLSANIRVHARPRAAETIAGIINEIVPLV